METRQAARLIRRRPPRLSRPLAALRLDASLSRTSCATEPSRARHSMTIHDRRYVLSVYHQRCNIRISSIHYHRFILSPPCAVECALTPNKLRLPKYAPSKPHQTTHHQHHCFRSTTPSTSVSRTRRCCTTPAVATSWRRVGVDLIRWLAGAGRERVGPRRRRSSVAGHAAAACRVCRTCCRIEGRRRCDDSRCR
jgi:hypothetical protein